MALFEYRHEKTARAFFDRWHSWAVRSHLKPMVEVAKMLRRRIENILTYVKHRVTNAKSEAINSKIQWVKYTPAVTATSPTSSRRSISTAGTST